MTDERDPLITLSEAKAVLAEKYGRTVSRPTLKRWIGGGCRGVRLQHFRMGGWIYTRRSWLQAFMDRLNSPPVELGEPVLALTRPGRERLEAARQEAIRRGLLDETTQTTLPLPELRAEG